jgi:surface antigen
MRRFGSLFGLLLVLALSACGGAPQHDVGLRAPVECVPFARALSGIHLRGDAPDWWQQAEGRYARGLKPEVGAVMVFADSPRLPSGHLSVVTRLMSQRQILVTHANWVPHRVTTDQLVLDVSPDGDWSEVRVWWPVSDTLGNTRYQVLGFIYSGSETNHDRIARTVPSAVRMALDE